MQTDRSFTLFLQTQRDALALQVAVMQGKVAAIDAVLDGLDRLDLTALPTVETNGNGNGNGHHDEAPEPVEWTPAPKAKATVTVWMLVKAYLKEWPNATRDQIVGHLMEHGGSHATHPAESYAAGISNFLRDGRLKLKGDRFVIARRRFVTSPN